MTESFFRDLTEKEKEYKKAWLEDESNRADARADNWIENGLRLGLILNAGGVLSLITASGALLGDNQDLSDLMPAAYFFLTGLVVAALGTLIATFFFNHFSTWTNDMYRKVIKNEISREDENTEDEAMSCRHTWFQNTSLLLIFVAFILFSIGAFNGMDGIQSVTIKMIDEKNLKTSSLF